MVANIRPNEEVFDDDNYIKLIDPDQVIDGQRRARGLIPRNFDRNPVGSYASARAFTMDLIPRNDWPGRIKDQLQAEARLSDIRLHGNGGQAIPSLDQDGVGYCWCHSPVSCALVIRAKNNQPYKRLSPFAVGAMIKRGRDEGGWNPQALDFIMARGVPTVEFWPHQSRDYQRYDKPEVWNDAAKYRIEEGFVDLQPAVYDRNLTFDQVVTCLLSNIPVAGDFNFWSHSVAILDIVDIDPTLSLTDVNRWGIRIWNSWSDSWGDRGMGILRGRKAIPDGATAPRSMAA